MRFLVLLLTVLSAGAANVIPNSSFEAGTGRGWLPFQWGNDSAYGNPSFISALLTNIAFHGSSSFCIPREARLLSRMVFLTNGTWCLSYYARTANGTPNATFNAGILRGNELYATIPTTNTAGIDGTWTRYATNYVVTTNAWHWLKFYNKSATVFIDAIQLEPTNSPSAYAPMATVECGIVMGGTDSMFFTGDTPSFQLAVRNEGIEASVKVGYEVFDAWNSNLVTSSLSIQCAAADTTTRTITLPTRTGWMRIVSRLFEFNDSYDEAHTIFYPYASNTVGNATNDWLGGHSYCSTFHATREGMTGRHFARTLSPNYFNTRWDVVEPTRGNMTFRPYQLSNSWANGEIILGCLTPTDTAWPTWATNANGSADLMAWSNFCFRCVQTNKTWVQHWEVGPNEPYQSGPTGFGPFDGSPVSDPHAGGTNLPINVRVATNYAKCLAYGVAGITNADVNAKIIGIAGAFGDGQWAWEAWTNLSANIQGWIYAVSTHFYVEDQRYDPNDPFYTGITAGFSYPQGWVNTFNGVRPVWNTEGGAFGSAYIQGLNGLWPRQDAAHPGTYDSLEDWAAQGLGDVNRSEPLNRSITETMRILVEALRCIGFGYEKFFYYDSREWNDASFLSTQPYPADYLQVDRPELVALSVAQSPRFIRRGFGPITNASAFPIEMYMFTNGLGQSVVAAWNADRLNRTLTTTNGSFAQHDCMGNQGPTNSLTARITRVPQYFISGSLSVAQLSNTFKFAGVSTNIDLIPPQVSIDVAPSGIWSGLTSRQLFKWTAVDDTYVAWPSNFVTLSTQTATNVVYKWKLDNGSYNSYSQSNHVWIANLGASNHVFYVTASDKNGNAQEWRYEFSPQVVDTTVLNVSGQMNIGIMVIPP